MMKFTALNVSLGDSFLLEIDSKKILVDTGNSRNECENLLSAKQIKNLDLIIITHYDSDHINGLLEVLESNISVTEIWLPENFGRIKETLKEKKDNLLKKIINNDAEPEYLHSKIIIETNTSKRYTHIFININDDNDITSNKVVSYIRYLEKKNNISEKVIKNMNDNTVNVIQPLSNILITYIEKRHIIKIDKIVNECENKKIKIRWMKYTHKLENKKVNNNINLLCVNGKENKNIKEYIDDIETIYYLSKINSESLVYKYHSNDKTPNVLFSADSGFEFLGKKEKIKLNNNSLITAAHHGSSDQKNINTYRLVNGENLIYVRSYHNQIKKPCCEYIRLEGKYCVKCINDNTTNEIILDYNNGWNTKRKKCSCSINNC